MPEDNSVQEFLVDYKEELETCESEKKKAIIRLLLSEATLDSDELTLHSNIESLTGTLETKRSGVP